MPVLAGRLVIFRSICNIQEKLFFQYSVQWGQNSFFLSDQNCQLFLFKNKGQQYGLDNSVLKQ